LPAVLLAFITLRVLTDRPTDARWLNDTERQWLVNAMEHDVASRKILGFTRGHARLHAVLLALCYFGIIMGLYGFGIWLPQIVKNLFAGIRHGFPQFVVGSGGMQELK
jgi:ACS family tartrate transporter-like MFS transporter